MDIFGLLSSYIAPQRPQDIMDQRMGIRRQVGILKNPQVARPLYGSRLIEAQKPRPMEQINYQPKQQLPLYTIPKNL